MRARFLFAIALGTGLLPSCAPRVQPGALQPPKAAASMEEEIRISRGPCFGFCPVYSVAVTPSGNVAFKGERHTEVLGERTHAVGRQGYADVRQALQALRPVTGAEQAYECKSPVPTDMASYSIEWIAADGTRTALIYNTGCRDPEAQQISETITRQVERLGAEGWAAQKTRPGANRG